MAGFFRKVAGAFVEIEQEAGGGDSAGGSAPNLDDITNDAADLLAQLEHAAPGSPGSGTSAAAPPIPGPANAGDGADGGELASSAMNMNAEAVFAASGLVDGANSAERVLKVIAGLKMFPTEQQIVMIRAMDAADDTWAEPEVMEDARKRQSVLRSHLQSVEQERAGRLKRLQDRISSTQAEGQSIRDEIDKQIASLQAQREEAVVATTNAVSGLEAKIHQLESDAERARRGITQVINALSGLITFFTGGSKPAAGA